ncbi:MarR family winged helix-turn-helix transcriptional regulator [Burkholderia sp. 22PA0099]|uniref:MarR family winged helix-turn-helix transcriptional regulator n=1 Tax=Burkholderia sp. 22PA0099 TaxID=3237372 RepID=UPI0039C3BA4B
MPSKPDATNAPAAPPSDAEAREHFASLACTHTALRRAARRLGNLYDDAMAPSGLKSTQAGLLAEVERITQRNGNQPPTLQDLADQLAVQISAVTHALRPLIRDGLVALRPDAQDRRVKRVTLTADGQARLQVAFEHWREANERVETVLGTADAVMLRRLADQVSSDTFLAAYDRDRDESRD